MFVNGFGWCHHISNHHTDVYVLVTACTLTHWGRDKMGAIFQTTVPNAFSWMKIYEFRLKFHWNLFPGVQLTIFQHWFRWWLGADKATSHYLNQRWYSLLTHICVTRPQWVKSSGSIDATGHHKYYPTFFRYWLFVYSAPSHYPNK